MFPGLTQPFKLRAALAVAALASALPAQAQWQEAQVEIEVTVEPIAILVVIEGEGEMLIDDTSFTFMGLPSSEGSVENITVGSLAQMRLLTNVCLDFMLLDFPRASGFRNAVPGAFLGVATGEDTGRTLGVWPRVHWIDPSDGLLHQPGFTHDGSNDDLVVRGPDGVNDQFCNGIHELGLGVETDWTTTLLAEPEFIAPDTYTIPLTGTLVP